MAPVPLYTYHRPPACTTPVFASLLSLKIVLWCGYGLTVIAADKVVLPYSLFTNGLGGILIGHQSP